MSKIKTKVKTFFGFKKIPFTKHVNSCEYFLHPNFEKGLKRLVYLAERRGIGLMIGGPGAGKSTLIRAFIESIGRTAYQVVYVDQTTCTIRDLYSEIATGFGIEPCFRKSDLLRRIKERLLNLSKDKRICPVLTIDEAHLLNRSFFDEIRMICNFDVDSKEEMMLLLSGHPVLETSLRLAINESFSQRIVLKVRLNGLTIDEVENYVVHRLQLVGRTAPIFTPDGIEALFRGSRGIPRKIDRIAEVSLILAAEDKQKEIGQEIVNRAVEEVEP